MAIRLFSQIVVHPAAGKHEMQAFLHCGIRVPLRLADAHAEPSMSQQYLASMCRKSNDWLLVKNI